MHINAQPLICIALCTPIHYLLEDSGGGVKTTSPYHVCILTILHPPIVQRFWRRVDVKLSEFHSASFEFSGGRVKLVVLTSLLLIESGRGGN